MNRLKTARRRQIRQILPQVCVRCGATTDLSIDHILPRVYGGGNALSNLQMLCLPCHQQKARKEVRYRDPLVNWHKGRKLARRIAAAAAATPKYPAVPPLLRLCRALAISRS